MIDSKVWHMLRKAVIPHETYGNVSLRFASFLKLVFVVHYSHISIYISIADNEYHWTVPQRNHSFIPRFGDGHFNLLRWWFVAWRHHVLALTIVDLLLISICGIHLRETWQRVLKPLLCIMNWNDIFLKTLPHPINHNQYKKAWVPPPWRALLWQT